MTAADTFVEALANRDYAALADCLTDNVRFRALTPNHTFGHFGALSAVETIRDWVDECTEFQLLESDVAPIGDRFRLRYRFRLQDADGWHLMEQHAYCAIANQRISDISIVCSGYRPETAGA
jgi:hypothetical protein